MKHFFNFTAFAIITMMIGCATSNEYIVTGKDTTGRCPDGEWAYLCLQKENPGDFHYIDSVQIENNSFHFEGEIETPTIAHIMTRAYNDSLRLAKPAVVHSFILEKGQIQTAFKDDVHCPSGTPLNDKISAFFNGLISLLQNAEQQNLSEDETLRQGFEYVKNIVQDTGTTTISALMLAIGIGLQNVPEGMAVSLPLRNEGMSRRKAFFYGQASGLVEPISGIIGAVLVGIVKDLLPFILCFASGAMIYVVAEELIPSGKTSEKNKFGTIGVIIGFAVMMADCSVHGILQARILK